MTDISHQSIVVVQHLLNAPCHLVECSSDLTDLIHSDDWNTRRHRFAALLLGVAGSVAMPALLLSCRAEIVRTPQQGFEIVQSYPHDPAAWTQGLVYQDGELFEGTGRRGHSALRLVDLPTGEILRSTRLADAQFGEGVTIWQDRIIQLTWKGGIGFVYDKDTFELLRTFSYPTEGWGITHDGSYLVMSDGSAVLRFWDPETFEEVRSVEVTAQGEPVANLNELEYVDGEILANVWQTDFVVRIRPEDGAVVGWIDLSGLLSGADGAGVLNGIAYDTAGDRLFVTGKYWPKLFEIDLVDTP